MTDVRALQMANGIRFGTGLATGIILARSGLALEMIALYEMLFFLGNLFSFLWINGGKNALLSAWPDYQSYGEKTVFRHLILLFGGAGLLAGGLLLLSKPIILHYTAFTEMPYLSLMALWVLFSIPASLTDYYFLLTRRFKAILGYSLFTNLGTLACVGIPLLVKPDLEAVFIGLTVLALAQFVFLLAVTGWRPGALNLDRPLIRRFALLSLPFVGHAALGGLANYIDGFIVLHHFTAEEIFAIYRYGAREIPFSTILVGGVVTAIVPLLRKDIPGQLDRLKAQQIKLYYWIYPIAGVLMLASPWLFATVYGPVFRESATIFNVYLLVLSSRIILPQTILYGYQKGSVLMMITGLELILNVVLSLILVEYWGLTGIAWATVVAFLFGKGLMVLYNWKRLTLSPLKYLPMRHFFLFNIGLALAYFISTKISLP